MGSITPLPQGPHLQNRNDDPWLPGRLNTLELNDIIAAVPGTEQLPPFSAFWALLCVGGGGEEALFYVPGCHRRDGRVLITRNGEHLPNRYCDPPLLGLAYFLLPTAKGAPFFLFFLYRYKTRCLHSLCSTCYITFSYIIVFNLHKNPVIQDFPCARSMVKSKVCPKNHKVAKE